MPANANILRTLRKVHLYFGVFIAPALLFFAFTGALQTLSLHEGAGSDYKAPAWAAALGQLHKKQTPSFPPRKPAPPAGADSARPAKLSAAPQGPPAPPVTLAAKQRQHLPMKLFFLTVCLGLFTSTVTGLYMAYRYNNSKLAVSLTLLAGFVVPLLLLKF